MTIRHAELRWQQEKRSRVRTLYAARSGMILRVSEVSDVGTLLSHAQMHRVKPFFPKPRSLPRVNDRRVGSST